MIQKLLELHRNKIQNKQENNNFHVKKITRNKDNLFNNQKLAKVTINNLCTILEDG
jgi:hypothetical protein